MGIEAVTTRWLAGPGGSSACANEVQGHFGLNVVSLCWIFTEARVLFKPVVSRTFVSTMRDNTPSDDSTTVSSRDCEETCKSFPTPHEIPPSFIVGAPVRN